MTSAADPSRDLVPDEPDDLVPDELEGTASAERRIGQIIADTYRIARFIGSGGSSHVYEAEHLRLGRRFAVKLLRPELGTGRKLAQRFRREAKAIARLQNEHIVSVIDSGDLEDHTPYLVMELLQGEDLRSLLRREKQLPVRRAIQIVVEACRGLSAVHEAGLVHRDLKPENLFLTRRSTGEDWCKVLDFGVVKMEASQSTAQGAIIGTVRYMAPEQLSDGTAVGPATDVYAVGAILYECLTGTPLVDGQSAQELMYQVMNAKPKPLASARPGLPPALCELIERCVSKAPAERPQDADQLCRALHAFLLPESRRVSDTTLADETSISRSSSVKRQPADTRRLIPLAVGTLLLAASAGWAVRGSRDAAREVTPPLPLPVGKASPTSGLPPKLLVAPPASIGTNVTPSAPSVKPLPSLASVAVSSKTVSVRRSPAAAPPPPPSARTTANHGPAQGHFDNSNPYE